ncbi:hypothetical protein SK128_004120, partial [Halocaridina rubra]
CSAVCQNTSGCWIFTWDTATLICSLPTSIQSEITTETASPTLQTYYISSMDGKAIIMSPSQGYWQQVKTDCENMQGSLYLPPDSAYALVLHHALGKGRFWTGMYREPSMNSIWYTMDEHVVSQRPDWQSGQPDDNSGNEYYTILRKGFLHDVDEYQDQIFGLCEI